VRVQHIVACVIGVQIAGEIKEVGTLARANARNVPEHVNLCSAKTHAATVSSWS